MQLWPVAHFISLTFGWVCCCFAVAPTQKWVKKVGKWSELHSEKQVRTNCKIGTLELVQKETKISSVEIDIF